MKETRFIDQIFVKDDLEVITLPFACGFRTSWDMQRKEFHFHNFTVSFYVTIKSVFARNHIY